MTATTMSAATRALLQSELGFNPATAALEKAQRTLFHQKSSSSSLDSTKTADLLSSKFCTMTFETEAFPVICWDEAASSSDEEEESSLSSYDSSERNLGEWSSFLSDNFEDNTSSHSPPSVSNKRSRNSEEGRLMRSKKIKSNLSTLAVRSSF